MLLIGPHETPLRGLAKSDPKICRFPYLVESDCQLARILHEDLQEQRLVVHDEQPIQREFDDGTCSASPFMTQRPVFDKSFNLLHMYSSFSTDEARSSNRDLAENL